MLLLAKQRLCCPITLGTNLSSFLNGNALPNHQLQKALTNDFHPLRAQTALAMLQSTSTLCGLPVEIIEAIGSILECPDLGSLRLACKILAQNTAHIFGLHFATILTNLSSTDLEMLDDLSRHSQLNHCVKTLLFEMDEDYGDGFSWNRGPTGILEFPHPALQMLQDALQRLENCRSFEISCSQERAHVPGNADLAAIIFHVIAEGSLPVRSVTLVETLFEWNHNLLDRQIYRTPAWKHAWAHLQALCLHGEFLPEDETVDDTIAIDWMTELIASASGLKYLSLDSESEICELLEKLSSCEELPKLEELSLRSSFITGQDLSRFLLRFSSSLRNLHLDHITIGGNWNPVLEQLKSSFPLLEAISLKSLHIRTHGTIVFSDDLKNTYYGSIARSSLLGVFPMLYENASALGFEQSAFTTTHESSTRSGEIRRSGIQYRGRGMMVQALDVITKSLEFVK